TITRRDGAIGKLRGLLELLAELNIRHLLAAPIRRRGRLVAPDFLEAFFYFLGEIALLRPQRGPRDEHLPPEFVQLAEVCARILRKLEQQIGDLVVPPPERIGQGRNNRAVEALATYPLDVIDRIEAARGLIAGQSAGRRQLMMHLPVKCPELVAHAAEDR